MSLAGKRVLIGRLATSEDLMDERTGMTLNTATRSLASSGACARIAESWSKGNVACFDHGRLAGSPAMAELERLFARDTAIPEHLWQGIREASVAEYAILFRPESVAGASLRTTEVRGLEIPIAGTGAAIVTAQIVAALIEDATRHVAVVRTTRLEYTVSASLVDLRTGKLLKVGVHTAGAARQVERDLGFAEAPPAAFLLEEIMVALGEKMLDE